MKFSSIFTHTTATAKRLLALQIIFLLLMWPVVVCGQKKGPTDKQLAAQLGISKREVKQLRRALGLTAADLQGMSEEALREARLELIIPERPEERTGFQELQLKDERGVAPNNARQRAIQQLESNRVRTVVSRAAKIVAGLPVNSRADLRCLMPAAASIEPCKWIALGPGNIGGRTRSIAISPDNPQLIWTGTPGGGLWHSKNGGETFAPVDDRMINLAITSIAIDPTDSRILYAGTGEGFTMNENILRGVGIFRTTDGETWKLLEATGPNNPSFNFTNKLAISKDGRVLLAATNSGLLRSINRERRDDWSNTLPEKMADVEFHPTDSNRVVAAGRVNGKAYYSTDGGLKWDEASHAGREWAGRVELTYALADPSIVYAALAGKDSSSIWRSGDGGKTYQMMKTVSNNDQKPINYLGKQGWYGNSIWAGDPNNKDFIIVGGLDLWKSVDGGHNLIRISNHHKKGSVHVDQHCIISDPAFGRKNEAGVVINKRVFFCNDGGISIADDIDTVGMDPNHAQNWRRVDKSYGVTQFQGAAGNPRTGVIIGGAQDNATVRYTEAGGPDGWREIDMEGGGGDGTLCAADPTDDNYFYASLPRLGLHRSKDRGLSSQSINGWYINKVNKWAVKPSPYNIPDAFSESKKVRAGFLAPFILDPNDSKRMLAGGLSLWRTNDVRAENIPYEAKSGPQWFEIKESTGIHISAIEIARSDSNIIWVGDNNGSVFKTVEGLKDKPVWIRVDESGSQPLPDRVSNKITIDPVNPQTVYVVYGGYSSGNVWKTIDGGLSWQQLDQTKTLPEAPVYDIAIHPQNSSYLYIATEVGVFASDNGGADWFATNQGPTNCPVRELFWMNTTLVVATYGRGMFKIDLTLPTP